MHNINTILKYYGSYEKYMEDFNNKNIINEVFMNKYYPEFIGNEMFEAVIRAFNPFLITEVVLIKKIYEQIIIFTFALFLFINYWLRIRDCIAKDKYLSAENQYYSAMDDPHKDFLEEQNKLGLIKNKFINIYALEVFCGDKDNWIKPKEWCELLVKDIEVYSNKEKTLKYTMKKGTVRSKDLSRGEIIKNYLVIVDNSLFNIEEYISDNLLKDLNNLEHTDILESKTILQEKVGNFNNKVQNDFKLLSSALDSKRPEVKK